MTSTISSPPPIQYPSRTAWWIKTSVLSLIGGKWRREKHGDLETLAAKAKSKVKVLMASRTRGKRMGKGNRRWVPAVLWLYILPLPPIPPSHSCSYWPARGDVMPRPTFYWAYAANRLVNSTNWQSFAEYYSLCPLNTPLSEIKNKKPK